MVKSQRLKFNVRLAVPVLVCLVGGLSPAVPALRVDGPAEATLGVTFLFGSGSATFKLDNGVAQAIDVRVGQNLYTTPLSGCTRVENIRFETVQFFNSHLEGTFTLTFRMGADGSASFGKLPWVQIAFNDGHRVGAIVTRATGASSEATFPLCRNQ